MRSIQEIRDKGTADIATLQRLEAKYGLGSPENGSPLDELGVGIDALRAHLVCECKAQKKSEFDLGAQSLVMIERAYVRLGGRPG